MKQKKVIFDTDLGADCDDVMALDFIMAADKCGDCELIGVTYSGDVFNAIPCIYAILREHGYEYIPIGSTEITGTSQRNWDIYATKVVDKFSYPDAPTYETVPSAVSLLRRLLSESEEPVKIISTGFFTNLADLIESGPDEYSPLDGAALLKEKGIISKIEKDGVKVLGSGELTKRLTVQVAAFTRTAQQKIEALGGKAEVV